MDIFMLDAILIATSKIFLAGLEHGADRVNEPTIIEGDRIFVNKLAYDLKVPYTTIHLAEWDNPERGEIVVFYSPEDGKRLVKRVVGVPGDTISMQDSKLYINGKPLSYRYPEESDFNNFLVEDKYKEDTIIEDLNNRIHPVLIHPRYAAETSFDTKNIPEGKYFMMGDNRYNALLALFRVCDRADSGQGNSNIIAWIKHMYKPRFERFFERLP
jgi:signal peptidase I